MLQFTGPRLSTSLHVSFLCVLLSPSSPSVSVSSPRLGPSFSHPSEPAPNLLAGRAPSSELARPRTDTPAWSGPDVAQLPEVAPDVDKIGFWPLHVTVSIPLLPSSLDGVSASVEAACTTVLRTHCASKERSSQERLCTAAPPPRDSHGITDPTGPRQRVSDIVPSDR